MDQPRHNHPSQQHHHGSILLLVLAAIMIMSLATSTFLLLMQNEHRATHNHGYSLQTKYSAQSGITYLKELLSDSTNQLSLQGGLQNNSNLFESQLVVDDAADYLRGRFTIISADITTQGEYSGFQYGLENESAKLNLNNLLDNDDETTNSARERLLAIPGMDATIADAILDWLDDDNDTREQGAEQDYYQSLTPAYTPRNGPISSLNELLMVRGVTAELLYGLDINRNFTVDTNESPRGLLLEMDNSQGQLDRGWSAYLTVHSLESNLNYDKEEKINLNDSDISTIHSELSRLVDASAANFIVACRQDIFTNLDTDNSDSQSENSDPSTIEIDFEKEANNNIGSILDMIGAAVTIQDQNGSNNNPQQPGGGQGGNSTSQTYDSPWQDNPASYRQDFAKLLDNAVTSTSNSSGRVNIQLASRPVLLSIPSMTETLADQIISRREVLDDPSTSDQRHPSWLLADGLVTLEEMRQLWPYITTGGDIYSAQVVGFFDSGNTQSRIRVVFDCSGETPRLIDWEDLSQLGPGFTSTELGALPTTSKNTEELSP